MTQSILQRIFRRPAGRSMHSRAYWKIASAIAGLALAATTAAAAVVAGAVIYSVPASVVLDQTESNVQIIVFDEPPPPPQFCFEFDHVVPTDQGAIPAHTKMSSYFFHSDPVAMSLLNGGVIFNNPIIGVISTTALLNATDPYFARPGVAYPPPPPSPNAEPYRGLEGQPQADQYQIVAGGFGISLTMQVPSASDQIRVLTCCGSSCT